MFLHPSTGKSFLSWPAGSHSTFLCSKWHSSLTFRCHFTGPNPLPLALVMNLPATKPGRINQRSISSYLNQFVEIPRRSIIVCSFTRWFWRSIKKPWNFSFSSFSFNPDQFGFWELPIVPTADFPELIIILEQECTYRKCAVCRRTGDLPLVSTITVVNNDKHYHSAYT